MSEKQKTYPICSFKDNTKIKLVGLEKQYKNIKVQHVNECGTTICGLHLIDGSFKQLSSNFVISNSTPAIIDDGKDNEIKETDDNEQRKEELIQQIIKIKTEDPVSEKRSVRNKEIQWPTGEFTCDELANLNNISKANAYQKIIKNKNVSIAREINGGGRGRPTKVYIIK